MAVHGNTHVINILVIELSSDGTDPENADRYNVLTSNEK